MRTLVVDTIDPAKPNTDYNGLLKAYQRVGKARAYHYRQVMRESGQEAMNKNLLAIACEYKPDILHLDKTNRINPWIIRKIKGQTGAYVVQWYGDLRDKLPSHVFYVGRHCDITYFTHNGEDRFKTYRERGLSRVAWLPYGTDPDLFKPCRSKDHQVCFMLNWQKAFWGTNEARKQLIASIAKADIPVHLYGKDNQKFGLKGVALHESVYKRAFAEACSRALVALAYSESVPYYTSWPRVLNTMACGTVCLTNEFPGIESLFKNHVHLCWYKDFDEAVEIALHLLAHPEECKRIGLQGREEVIANHTWDHRVRRILKDAKMA